MSDFKDYFKKAYPELDSEWGQSGELITTTIDRIFDAAAKYIDKKINELEEYKDD